MLVNNAGGDAHEPPFPDADDALWVRLADLNLLGVVRCIRAALPHLIAAPAGGAVVTIGSVNGLAAFGSYPYSAAKAGLESLTKNLAAEYGRSGVRFNLIAPAPSVPASGTPSRAPWRAFPASTHWAESVNRRMWPPPLPSSPPTTRPGSPGSRCRSTAASSPVRRHIVPPHKTTTPN